MKLIFVSLFFISLMNQASAQMFKQMPAQTRCQAFSSNWTPGYNSNIVGYWQMNGALGAIANGAAIPATIGTGGTMNGTTSTYVASAMQSQSITMTGVNADNNYITIGTPAALNDLTAMSLMMWVKVPNKGDLALAYKSDGNGSAGWFLVINSTKRLYFAVVSATDNLQYITSNNMSLVAGTWAQVVVTWSGGQNPSAVKIYVNAEEWTTTDSGYTQPGVGAHNTDAAQPLYFGNRASGVGTTNNFEGEMDEVAIWNRALSPAEVAYLYKNQKCN
jgi:hypothetical protein